MEAGDKKYIFVFTGPDGSGRKTVADAVGLTLGLRKVISYTTRSKRPAEEDGQDYHFVTESEFQRMVDAGEFLEHLTIDGNRYGVKEADILKLFERGSVYLVLNRHGAQALKERFGDQAVRIFIYADRRTVHDRQIGEGFTESFVEKRLEHYDEDMAYGPQCEHSVENIGDLGHTIFHVTNILEEYLERDLVDKD